MISLSCKISTSLHEGEAILRKIIEAIPERNDHQEDLCEFEKSLVVQYGTQLSKWKAEYEAWVKDMSLPNPFEVKPSGMYCFSHVFLQFRLKINQQSHKHLCDCSWLGTRPIHWECKDC